MDENKAETKSKEHDFIPSAGSRGFEFTSNGNNVIRNLVEQRACSCFGACIEECQLVVVLDKILGRIRWPQPINDRECYVNDAEKVWQPRAMQSKDTAD